MIKRLRYGLRIKLAPIVEQSFDSSHAPYGLVDRDLAENLVAMLFPHFGQLSLLDGHDSLESLSEEAREGI